jgi:secreted PhoX family phosphatase
MRKHFFSTNKEAKKQLILLFLLVVFTTELTAQYLNTDSLKKVVVNARTEAEKVGAFITLAENYSEFNSDSGYHYAALAKATAIKSNIKSAEGYAIGVIVEVFYRKGNYTQDFLLTNEAFKIL